MVRIRTQKQLSFVTYFEYSVDVFASTLIRPSKFRAFWFSLMAPLDYSRILSDRGRSGEHTLTET